MLMGTAMSYSRCLYFEHRNDAKFCFRELTRILHRQFTRALKSSQDFLVLEIFMQI